MWQEWIFRLFLCVDAFRVAFTPTSGCAIPVISSMPWLFASVYRILIGTRPFSLFFSFKNNPRTHRIPQKWETLTIDLIHARGLGMSTIQCCTAYPANGQ